MTRLGIPPAVVLLVLLVGGCSSPNAPAETTDTATPLSYPYQPFPDATQLADIKQRVTLAVFADDAGERQEYRP